MLVKCQKAWRNLRKIHELHHRFFSPPDFLQLRDRPRGLRTQACNGASLCPLHAPADSLFNRGRSPFAIMFGGLQKFYGASVNFSLFGAHPPFFHTLIFPLYLTFFKGHSSALSSGSVSVRAGTAVTSILCFMQ